MCAISTVIVDGMTTQVGITDLLVNDVFCVAHNLPSTIAYDHTRIYNTAY